MVYALQLGVWILSGFCIRVLFLGSPWQYAFSAWSSSLHRKIKGRCCHVAIPSDWQKVIAGMDQDHCILFLKMRLWRHFLMPETLLTSFFSSPPMPLLSKPSPVYHSIKRPPVLCSVSGQYANYQSSSGGRHGDRMRLCPLHKASWTD